MCPSKDNTLGEPPNSTSIASKLIDEGVLVISRQIREPLLLNGDILIFISSVKQDMIRIAFASKKKLDIIRLQRLEPLNKDRAERSERRILKVQPDDGGTDA